MAAGGRKMPLTCYGHERPVVDVSYGGGGGAAGDGFFIVSASKDGKPMLRNGITGDWIGTFDGHKGAVWAAHLDSRALRAVTGSADFSCALWDALTGEQLRSVAHPHIVRAARFAPDDSLVATGCHDKALRVLAVETGQETVRVRDAHADAVRGVCWPGGRAAGAHTVVTASADGVRLWDLRSPARAAASAAGDVLWLDAAWDGRHFVAAGGKTVRVFDAAAALKHQVTLDAGVNAASLSLDGSQLVVGGVDYRVAIVDIASAREIEVLKGHFGPVHCTGWSPDGRTVCSGSEDGTVRLWQTGEPSNYGLWQLKTAAPSATVGAATTATATSAAAAGAAAGAISAAPAVADV